MAPMFLSVFLLGALTVVGGSSPSSAQGSDNVESGKQQEYWQAQAWRAASGEYPVPADFPEMLDADLMSRPNTGVVFTGGGSRSYLASTGYMAALHELDLVKNIRYITGISGGAWFTMSYSFAANGASDEVLLGPILDPSEFSLEKLQEMNPQCMRAVTNGNFVPAMLQKMKETNIGIGEGWINQVQAVYMDPLGIKGQQPVAWNAQHANDIRTRNPSLGDADFTMPTNVQRPFPIVGSTIVGPDAGAPYSSSGDGGGNRNFTMFEMSPLYVGSLLTTDVEYKYSKGMKHTIRVGGAIESFAYNRHGTAPASGLTADELSGVLSVPAAEATDALDPAHMAGASGYAIGAFMDTLPLGIPSNTSLHMNYWSPADASPKERDTLFADGGCYENLLVTSMLQRRVEKIVLFFNVHQPLQPAANWDVANDAPSKTQIARDLAAFFGVFPEDYSEWEIRGFDLSYNQVWSNDMWVPLVTALQSAQAKGSGVVVTMNLTTIQNDRWGIPAGIETEVTFVYLSRLFEWEKQLPVDMVEYFVPSDPTAAVDASQTVDQGPFNTFPNYPTICAGEDVERANALADLTGWTIRENAELFKSIFS